MKQDRKPDPDLDFSHRVTTLGHLANMAFRTGRRVQWEAVKETIAGDAEAAAMLAPPWRKGYELPEV